METQSNKQLDLNVICTCKYCGAVNKVKVRKLDFLRWRSGELMIQQAFPYLTPSQREQILSGTCDDCWRSMMSEDNY